MVEVIKSTKYRFGIKIEENGLILYYIYDLVSNTWSKFAYYDIYGTI